MDSSKACSLCGGHVDVEVIGESGSDSRICFASFVVGTCRSCGHTFTEAQLAELKAGPEFTIPNS